MIPTWSTQPWRNLAWFSAGRQDHGRFAEHSDRESSRFESRFQNFLAYGAGDEHSQATVRSRPLARPTPAIVARTRRKSRRLLRTLTSERSKAISLEKWQIELISTSGQDQSRVHRASSGSKNSVREYVFRFALELGHCLMQSACLKRANSGFMQRSKIDGYHSLLPCCLKGCAAIERIGRYVNERLETSAAIEA